MRRRRRSPTVLMLPADGAGPHPPAPDGDLAERVVAVAVAAIDRAAAAFEASQRASGPRANSRN